MTEVSSKVTQAIEAIPSDIWDEVDAIAGRNGRNDREWAQSVDRLRTALAEHLARHRIASSRQDELREALPVSVVVLQNCIGAIIEAVKPLVAFHETGGHEGDGSDAQLKKIREVLSTPIGKIAALSDISPLANEAPSGQADIALEKDAVARAMGAVLPSRYDWQHIREASKSFVATLAALSPEGGE